MQFFILFLTLLFIAQPLNAGGVYPHSGGRVAPCASGIVPVTPPVEEQQEEEGDLDSLKAELERLKEFLESLPKSEAAKRIGEALERLAAQIERLEKSLRDALEKDIVPWIRREIERLKKELFRYLEEPDEENKPRRVEAIGPCQFA